MGTAQTGRQGELNPASQHRVRVCARARVHTRVCPAVPGANAGPSVWVRKQGNELCMPGPCSSVWGAEEGKGHVPPPVRAWEEGGPTGRPTALPSRLPAPHSWARALPKDHKNQPQSHCPFP